MPHSLRDTKPLSVEEEHRLIALAQKGDREARERLVRANMRYVVKLANTRAFRSAGTDAEVEDYIQEGLYALHIAIDKFDFTKMQGSSMRLIGYAHSWVKVRQHNHALNNLSLVKYGTTQQQRRLFGSLSRGIDELTYMLRREPTDEELAEYLNVRVSDIAEGRLRLLSGRDLSLEAPVSGDEPEGMHFIDKVLSHEENIEEVYGTHEELLLRDRKLKKALERLDPRERFVIEKRTMLGDDEGMTLVEISKIWGVSRERVRQIEIRALTRLRKMYGATDVQGTGRYRKTSPGGNQAAAGNRGAPRRQVRRARRGDEAQGERGEGVGGATAGEAGGGEVPPVDQGSDGGTRSAGGSGQSTPSGGR